MPNEACHPRRFAIDSDSQIFATTGKILVLQPDGSPARTIGSRGAGRGQLLFPRGLVIKGESLFVADSDNKRISVFKKSDEFVETGCCQRAAAVGHQRIRRSLRQPEQSLHSGLHRARCLLSGVLQVFDEQGKFLRQFGSAGNASGQFNLLVCDRFNRRVQVLTAGGAFITEFAAGLPYSVHVDRDGRIFVGDDLEPRVRVFVFEA